MGSEQRNELEEMKKDWDNASDEEKKEMELEAREALEKEGLSDEKVNEALKKFKENDMDGLMKMKREMKCKGGKGEGKGEGKGDGKGKGGKKLAKKPKGPKKLVTLSEGDQ